MNTEFGQVNETLEEREERRSASPKRAHPLGTVLDTLGAVSGAGLGAMAAGPPGAVTGAIVGGAMGVTSGWAADAHAVEAAERDKRLDAEIGVSNGTIGAPNLEHPPARVGALSAESAGAARERGPTSPVDAQGPISPPTSE